MTQSDVPCLNICNSEGKNRKHALKNPIYLKKCTIISKENIVQK